MIIVNYYNLRFDISSFRFLKLWFHINFPQSHETFQHLITGNRIFKKGGNFNCIEGGNKMKK